jgi:hypothetical protein
MWRASLKPRILALAAYLTELQHTLHQSTLTSLAHVLSYLPFHVRRPYSHFRTIICLHYTSPQEPYGTDGVFDRIFPYVLR